MPQRPLIKPLGAARLFHTVRHLKSVQIYGRLLHRVRRARPNLAPAPRTRAHSGVWVKPTGRSASLFEHWRVRFLNEDGEIANAEQWNNPAKSKLWLYNLHYFDDLAAPADARRRALQSGLVARWIAENPPASGNGWEPYSVSLRIANWIKWSLAGATLEAAWLDSLAVQTRWLAKHIEWHLLGNHLAANAKALVMAGLFFEGAEADRWLDTGLSIYATELAEQILADGAHFELSPMYHAIILEDLLDLINLSRTYGAAGHPAFQALPAITVRMRQWLAAMSHPDGGIAFFNDAAFGIASCREELENYAMRLGFGGVAAPGEGLHHLAASGYVRVNRGEMSALLDLAAIGPDYIPGHAHADTLSFELSLGAERVIVNSGTSTYTPGPLRQAQRETRAHSTVEVACESSSQMWASFRVARRARVQDVKIEERDGRIAVAATHDGYARLPGRPLHRRTWRFEKSMLSIDDEVFSSVPAAAVAYFHLWPGITASTDGMASPGWIATPSGRLVRWAAGEHARVEPAMRYPEFGLSVPALTLAAPLECGRLTAAFDWS